MKIALITINYNNAGATIKLLETLRLNTDQDIMVVVVDNASELPDRAQLETFIRSEYPETVLLAMLQNREPIGSFSSITMQRSLRRSLPT